jgi:hypothetical protein
VNCLVAAIIAALVTEAATGSAAAAPPGDGAGPIFEVTVAGQPWAAAALAATLEEPLARAHLAAAITIEPRLRNPGLLDATVAGAAADARAVILLPEPEGRTPARIYLVDLRGHRLLARQVAVDPARPEIAREEIAHLVAGSLRALRDGAVVDMAPAPPPVLTPTGAAQTAPSAQMAPSAQTEPSGTPVSVRPSSAALRQMDLGVAVGVERWSAAAPLGKTIAASLLFDLTPVVRLWAVAEYRQVEETRAPVSLGVRMPSLVLGPGLLLARWARVALLATAGGGLARAHASAALTQPMPQAMVNEVPPRIIPFARAALRGEWRMTRHFALFASAGCDLLLSRPRYVVSWGSENVELLPAGRLRPTVAVGMEAVFGAHEL